MLPAVDEIQTEQDKTNLVTTEPYAGTGLRPEVLGAPVNMEHWRFDAAAAGLLAGAVRNDHI
ncbi:MAG: hypothetical protein COZ70_03090 [Deltaproteobacteria bacterium CG_4_8_14_3_um_filter_51_11]|nr:hypothetical protein [bacterium]OIP38307.1 MAG: hypothetical protein AUK25_13060 [Desulfobacteraceae bacterium CG2_30_51_40]PIP47225.1 MAG: hypothetical protein COX16_05530 [Deltaproteobacteria bacterium CG23_combo_of_CG06-09_8_20_14_all_51_20]PIX20525.1 MAG: hypothetical protein COZ70_03090 [Deltaproteobacteria bacterium CG_4_8_14_3_um_filter_51_11]PIY26581.1 MAG: hypothetical protein COZ11_02355 [Deltaproteobacteria bacterium CG_4_10_14_3_um_filter_51_14]